MIKAIKLKKIIIFAIIFLIIFAILYYKNFLFGNNIIKNRSNNKIDKILNSIQNYSAEASIIVKSNKTENEYVVYQEVSGDYSMQEVRQGEDVEGTKIELAQNILKISNSNINLEKVYENYNNLLTNAMFLNTFSADYKNDQNESGFTEENGEIILEVKLNTSQNTYIKYKKLYVDGKTLKPKKLAIQDNTKKETICIVYNEIELKK